MEKCDVKIIYSACSASKIKIACDMAAKGRTILYVANYDIACSDVIDQAKFFNPNLNILHFPAWDCIPYDRTSPSPDIVGVRINTLNEISKIKSGKGALIITSIKAISRLIPDKKDLFTNSISFKVNDELDMDEFVKSLVAQSYEKVASVREVGQFAVRGSIIDLFPAGLEDPIRIDLFGDEIESIKSFDPISQISKDDIDSFSCLPTSSIHLNDETVKTFVEKYEKEFEINQEDAVISAVEEKRKISGLEHMLPLCYKNKLVSIFDYMKDYEICFEDNFEHIFENRHDEIKDLYEARQEVISESSSYKPVSIDSAFLTEKTLKDYIENKEVHKFSDFKKPIDDKIDLDAGYRFIVPFKQGQKLFDNFKERIEGYSNKKIIIACYSNGALQRTKNILEDHKIDINLHKNYNQPFSKMKKGVNLVILPIEKGFEDDKICIITQSDLFGDKISRKVSRKRISAENFISEVSNLNVGDLVVHQDHGIGRFDGLELIEALGTKHEFLKISYKGTDKLYVPVENLEVLSIFGQGEAILDKLGGSAWQARKASVKRNLLEIAADLMKVAAKRELIRLEKLDLNYGQYQEFCSKFPYQETADQLRVIEEVITDMQTGRAMDRLVCGDVGFGKTEVAIRAAFAMCQMGKQVALVVPTTLLARQHFAEFKRRFAQFGLKIAQLSRLVTPAEANKVKLGLQRGEIDAVIGTHALFSGSVQFQDLGLLIIDEEQHFGVKQKEKIKNLKQGVHVLTLTATPIPRTLQLSLTGVRDLSLITTPPVDRIAVRTSILPYDSVIIKEALLKEHARGGQSFYVCPRIKDIPKIQKRLDTIAPNLKYITATGQLSGKDLDEKMSLFYEGQADVLIATNIIESGIDIPRANTMIIHKSEMFGLAQLYQLRGRVGRSKQRGYSYFTYSENKLLTEKAKKRLEVIETLDSLGAGFQLASYDLDIRGAGNLVGQEQSGCIKEVGLELYQEMLKDAVEQVKAGDEINPELMTDKKSTYINIGLSIMIPKEYVDDISLRMSLYKRASSLETKKEINEFEIEMIDRFGILPETFSNLLKIVELKQLAKSAGIIKIEAGPSGGSFTFDNSQIKDFDKLLQYVMNNPMLKLDKDDKISIIGSGWSDSGKRILQIKKILNELL